MRLWRRGEDHHPWRLTAHFSTIEISVTKGRSHCESAVQGEFLHLWRDFSQMPNSAYRSGNSPDISKCYFREPIGGSNPLWSASKSMKLNKKIHSPELCRHFRWLATSVTGVGH